MLHPSSGFNLEGEGLCSSKTFVALCLTIRCQAPEDTSFNTWFYSSFYRCNFVNRLFCCCEIMRKWGCMFMCWAVFKHFRPKLCSYIFLFLVLRNIFFISSISLLFLFILISFLVVRTVHIVIPLVIFFFFLHIHLLSLVLTSPPASCHISSFTNLSMNKALCCDNVRIYFYTREAKCLMEPIINGASPVQMPTQFSQERLFVSRHEDKALSCPLLVSGRKIFLELHHHLQILQILQYNFYWWYLLTL